MRMSGVKLETFQNNLKLFTAAVSHLWKGKGVKVSSLNEDAT